MVRMMSTDLSTIAKERTTRIKLRTTSNNSCTNPPRCGGTLVCFANIPTSYGSQPQLPPGWIQQRDADSQRYYYVEQATGRTQWEPPITCPSGGVPSQHYESGQPGHGDDAYRGAYYGQGEQKDSHTGMALAGGAALGAVGGAWAMHEYSKQAIAGPLMIGSKILTSVAKMKTKKKMRQRLQRQHNRPLLLREVTLRLLLETTLSMYQRK